MTSSSHSTSGWHRFAVLYSIFLPHWPLFCGGVVAATAAFFVGRVFQQRVLLWLSTMPAVSRQFAFCDRAIANGGFVAIFLLRLIPTPIPALNFLYGLTSIRASTYVLATAIGNLPGSTVIVSSAAMGKRLLFARSALGRAPVWQLATGAIVVAAVLIWFGRLVVETAKSRLVDIAGADECGLPAEAAEPAPTEAVTEAESADGCRCLPWLPRRRAEGECGQQDS